MAVAAPATTVPARDQPSGRVCRRGRPPRVDEASGFGRGRGIQRGEQRSPLPGHRMTLTDDLRGAILTSGLSDGERAELVDAGEEMAFVEGDVLFREGRPADQLWILLEGQVELSRRIGNQTIAVATMSTPGQWAGGLTAWGVDGEPAGYRATGTALSSGRCFVLPSPELARLVGAWSPFSKHVIGGVFQTVRSIDATARERESIMAL